VAVVVAAAGIAIVAVVAVVDVEDAIADTDVGS
jgi:hypothetical protein